jgi:hypothetical protein
MQFYINITYHLRKKVKNAIIQTIILRKYHLKEKVRGYLLHAVTTIPQRKSLNL